VTGITLDADLLDRADRLELFACTFAGTDHVPTDALRDHGVTVTNAGGIHAPGIAEQSIANMLVFARNLHEGWRRKSNSEWRHFQSHEFTDSTVTVVGLGSIGQAVVQRLAGFEVATIGIRYTPEKGGPTDEMLSFDDGDVHDAFARSDYVVLACPLTDLTRGMVGGPSWRRSRRTRSSSTRLAAGSSTPTPSSRPLQTEGHPRGRARRDRPRAAPVGPRALGRRKLPHHPHTGGHTPKHWDRLADIVATNVAALDAGDELENAVVTPE